MHLCVLGPVWLPFLESLSHALLAPLSTFGCDTQLCGVVNTWREGMASQGT